MSQTLIETMEKLIRLDSLQEISVRDGHLRGKSLFQARAPGTASECRTGRRVDHAAGACLKLDYRPTEP